MSIHETLLQQERESRQERQRLITRYHVRDALAALPEGHPAAVKLQEALALLGDR